jgi:hypothetical protein
VRQPLVTPRGLHHHQRPRAGPSPQPGDPGNVIAHRQTPPRAKIVAIELALADVHTDHAIHPLVPSLSAGLRHPTVRAHKGAGRDHAKPRAQGPGFVPISDPARSPRARGERPTSMPHSRKTGFVWRMDAQCQRRPPLGSFDLAARIAALLDTVAVIGRLSRRNAVGARTSVGWKSGGAVALLISLRDYRNSVNSSSCLGIIQSADVHRRSTGLPRRSAGLVET